MERYEPSALERAVVAQVAYEIEANGIPRAELARRIGMSDRSLDRKLNGERVLRLGEVESLAQALRTDVLTLIAEAGKRMENE